MLLLAVGEFHGFTDAFHQSAVNYTSLSYALGLRLLQDAGDGIPPGAWKTL